MVKHKWYSYVKFEKYTSPKLKVDLCTLTCEDVAVLSKVKAANSNGKLCRKGMDKSKLIRVQNAPPPI